jgi:hypothetical protein
MFCADARRLVAARSARMLQTRRNSYPVKKPGRHGTRHDASAAIKLLNPVLAREKSAPQHYLEQD